MTLPREQAKGLLLMADPHIADISPGHRLPGYREQILSKMRAGLDHAVETGMLPVFLGDLFHWPRDNSNELLVELIELFTPARPWVLVGNHDKYQARLTRDVSLSVLESAGAVRLMSEPGPQFVLETLSGDVLVGATPDGYKPPSKYERAESDPDTVVWLTHHNFKFPDYREKGGNPKELPGIDWLINGHIHRPQPLVVKGATTWANPGNMTRLTFSRRSKEREPAVMVWTPDSTELERWVVPHLSFYDVFPRREFPPEEAEAEGESGFLKGLERLAMRRTSEGIGLKEFLSKNLDPDQPESELIWEVYEEVVNDESR